MYFFLISIPIAYIIVVIWYWCNNRPTITLGQSFIRVLKLDDEIDIIRIGCICIIFNAIVAFIGGFVNKEWLTPVDEKYALTKVDDGYAVYVKDGDKCTYYINKDNKPTLVPIKNNTEPYIHLVSESSVPDVKWCLFLADRMNVADTLFIKEADIEKARKNYKLE